MKILLLIAFAAFTVPGPASAEEEPVRVWRQLSDQAAEEGDYGRALEFLGRIELQAGPTRGLNTRRGELLLGWGGALLASKRYGEAREVLFQVLDLFPEQPQALKGLGLAAYYRQDLDESLDYWNRALAVFPADEEAFSWRDRVEREKRLEGNLDGSRMGNFIFRFSREESSHTVAGMEDALHQAYREVGYDLGYYPDRPLVVILYPSEEFRGLTGVPRWAAGIYDGKIRVPADGSWSPEEFRRILWHEYTHALVHDLTRGRAPTWLQEGLAQYEEAKIIPIDLSPLGDLEPIPFASLNGAFSFKGSPERIRQAYLEAYSLLTYLIDRYGFWRVNAFLAGMGNGASWEEALREEFLLSPAELEEEWLDVR